MSTLVAMHGGLAALSVVIAVFFLRYWMTTRDSFFLWFAGAFAVFTANWIMRTQDVVGTQKSEPYWVRLVGFLMIAVAILLKNRRPPT